MSGSERVVVTHVRVVPVGGGAGGGAQEKDGPLAGAQVQEVTTIVFGTVVWVQLSDRNFCRFEVSSVSCSSHTTGPGKASMPSTRTRSISLASPEEMTAGVALEVAYGQNCFPGVPSAHG
jgi:hypothetical protein